MRLLEGLLPSARHAKKVPIYHAIGLPGPLQCFRLSPLFPENVSQKSKKSKYIREKLNALPASVTLPYSVSSVSFCWFLLYVPAAFSQSLAT